MRSKMPLYISITLVSAAAIFVVAFMYLRLNRTKIDEEEGARYYSRYYAMICDDYASSFWQYVYKGAAEAAEENDAYVELFGSNLNVDYSPEELMEMAISSKVDGIMVLGSGQEEMTGLIDKAVDSGIPVVTMYSDNAESKRCSFVGVSAYNIGCEYGKQIINARNDKIRLNAETVSANTIPTTVTVFFDDKNLLFDQSIILSGINDTLSREAEDIGFVIKALSIDNSNPFSVEENIRDSLMVEEVPDILVCLSELDTTCAYQAVIDYNMVGSVYILGYYDSEKILNAISRSVVFSSLAVDTIGLGRYCSEALDEYLEMGNTSQYFSADLTIIDRNNVAQSLRKEEEEHE